MKKRVIGLMIMLVILTGCAGNVKDGVELLNGEKYEEAIAVFEEDVKRGKNLGEAYRGIGNAYFALEQYEEAIEAFGAALKNETKETATIYGVMGACYMKLESYEKALDMYKKALKMKDITDELEQEIQYNLIAIYEYTGDWEAAKKQAKKYVKAYPDDGRIEKEAEFLETR